MLDLEIELLNEFLPVTVAEVSALHEVVAILHVLEIMKLKNAG
jgi:hypothetical protein